MNQPEPPSVEELSEAFRQAFEVDGRLTDDLDADLAVPRIARLVEMLGERPPPADTIVEWLIGEAAPPSATAEAAVRAVIGDGKCAHIPFIHEFTVSLLRAIAQDGPESEADPEAVEAGPGEDGADVSTESGPEPLAEAPGQELFEVEIRIRSLKREMSVILHSMSEADLKRPLESLLSLPESPRLPAHDDETVECLRKWLAVNVGDNEHVPMKRLLKDALDIPKPEQESAVNRVRKAMVYLAWESKNYRRDGIQYKAWCRTVQSDPYMPQKSRPWADVHNIAGLTRLSLDKLKEKGVYLGGEPLGMRRTDRVDSEGRRILEEDPEQLATVSKIMRLHNKNNSLRKIVTVLQRDGHRTKKGGRWEPATVKRVIDRNRNQVLDEKARKAIGERTKAVLDEKKQAGEVVGSAPYGYCAVDGKITVCEPEQENIAAVQGMRARGIPYREIVRTLADAGKVSRAGKAFTLQSVFAMAHRTGPQSTGKKIYAENKIRKSLEMPIATGETWLRPDGARFIVVRVTFRPRQGDIVILNTIPHKGYGFKKLVRNMVSENWTRV